MSKDYIYSFKLAAKITKELQNVIREEVKSKLITSPQEDTPPYEIIIPLEQSIEEPIDNNPIEDKTR